jgi:L,D-transpeptidase ErfK/SrfK
MSERRSRSSPDPGRRSLAATQGGRPFVPWISALLLVGALFGTTAFQARPVHEDVIGVMDAHMTVLDDTLLDVAIEHGLGYVEIVAANPGIDPWLPREGSFIVLPTMHVLPAAERRGIVINLADMRLYWFPPGAEPVTMPLGIGSEGWASPLGKTTVARKRVNPTWIPPASVRAEDPELPAAVKPGPDNPLGSYALDLGWPAIVIHGTNRPYGVGRRVSHGCFRLFDRDIERLYREVPVGTAVTVVDQPVKIGWREGALYLEVHPTQSQADELEQTGRFTPAQIPGLQEEVLRLSDSRSDRIDWHAVERAARERAGVPIQITR